MASEEVILELIKTKCLPKITLTFFRMDSTFSLLTLVSNNLSRDARPSRPVHPTHRGASSPAATSKHAVKRDSANKCFPQNVAQSSEAILLTVEHVIAVYWM